MDLEECVQHLVDRVMSLKRGGAIDETGTFHQVPISFILQSHDNHSDLLADHAFRLHSGDDQKLVACRRGAKLNAKRLL